MTHSFDTEFPTTDELRLAVSTDPVRAVSLARSVTAAEGVAGAVRCVAWSALGRALFDLGRHREATEAIRTSMTLLDLVDDADEALFVSLSAAVVLAESGAVADALAALDRTATTQDGLGLARVFIQRGYVLHHAGELREALLALDRADQLLGVGASDTDRFRLLVNRGLVLLQHGQLDAAEADLRSARTLAASGGYWSFEAISAANLGVLHARGRRIAESMRCFSEARHLYARAGEPARTVAIMQIDYAETLLHQGIVADAVEAARQAVRLIEPTGNQVILGDAYLMLARALLASGDQRHAVTTADRAAKTMLASDRSRMVAQARSVAVEAELAGAVDSERGEVILDEVSALVGELRSDGWHQRAAALQIVAIKAARRLGLKALVDADVEYLRLGAFGSDRDVLLAGWYAEGIARANLGDMRSAVEACKEGLGLIDDIVREAPTLEERSAAMRLGNDLSQLAIDCAIDLGDAELVFAAAEGTRARALHDEMEEVYRHRGLSEDAAAHLRGELTIRLSDRILVEWIEAHGAVWAVVLGATGARLVRVASIRDVLRARDRVVVWLDRAAEEPDASSRGAVRATALLDELLLAPLRLPREIGIVVVPVGELHGIPWAGLPGLSNREITVASSARVWLEADRRVGGASRSSGLIVGPGVATADVERRAVELAHPGVAIASGAGATASTVRSMFHGLDLVHVAAHGTFRSDHPLLSTLRLHDGESTLYDTVPDRVQSQLVILSSCQGGAHGASDGSEVLGLAAVMLARGAASVLAPLTVVRELECSDFVAEVHAELAAGRPLAAATAAVRQRWLGDDDLSRWAVASSFTCFGAGSVTVAPE